tara:strand:+ start:93 stop:308 length:216 start_codon:yes stop_codon:yes gene_type:complete
MSKDNKKAKGQCAINGVGISADLMKCKPSINTQKTIRYYPETKKVFDELDNFLGYGTYDEKSKIISIEHKY